MSQHTDLPSELGSYSDGSFIGCGPGSVGGPSIAVAGSLSDVAIGGSLSDVAIGGLPGYLFTQKNLSNPTVRRRIGAAIKAMSPKLRRRALSRLKMAVARATSLARVSGEVRSAYPSVAGWEAVSGTSIAVGRCPYANVAGALTP